MLQLAGDSFEVQKIGKMQCFNLLALSILFSIAVAKKQGCLNKRPIIGILSQRLTNRNIIRHFPFTHGRSYIHASYVKWIESAGARVVPIKDGMKAGDLKKLLESINGVVFPGGASSLYTSKYAETGKAIFQHAIKAKDSGKSFPIMGICLGFELLAKLVARANLLQPTDAKYISMKTQFEPDSKKSRMFAGLGARMKRLVSVNKLAYNNHRWGIYPRVFKRNARLRNFFKVLATSKDRKGVEFVAAVEAKRYPIYGLQWHPEKPSYEWSTRLNIDRSSDAIKFAQFMANLFVSETQNNCNKFKSNRKAREALIYAHYPVYTGEFSTAEQTYIF